MSPEIARLMYLKPVDATKWYRAWSHPLITVTGTVVYNSAHCRNRSFFVWKNKYILSNIPSIAMYCELEAVLYQAKTDLVRSSYISDDVAGDVLIQRLFNRDLVSVSDLKNAGLLLS